MVGVVVFAVGDDECGRVVEGERAVRLVGFDDQDTSFPRSRHRERPGFAADGPADGFAEGEEEAGDEGGGRRLAVGAADGDGFAGADEFGEDLAAVADAAGAGGFAGEGGGKLGVVAADGGREDDLVGVRDVRGVVSDGDGDAQGGEPASTRRGVEVASRDLVTLRLQQHGESRHADPADTGEMNLFSFH